MPGLATVATYVYRRTGVPKPRDERRRPNLQPVEIVAESFFVAP